MLMLQLYRSTCDYMEHTGIFRRSMEEGREELRAEVAPRFDEARAPEIEVHFTQMPERYFQFRDAESVTRHIGLFRSFIEHTTSTTGLEALHPVIEWIFMPSSGYTQLEICCWDRSHLLAKIAGALAAEEIKIWGADLFTRGTTSSWHIFRICTTNFEPVRSTSVQKRVETLLNQFLDETVDWTNLGDRFTPPKIGDEALIGSFPRRVHFSNEVNSRYTVLEVQALDRSRLALRHLPRPWEPLHRSRCGSRPDGKGAAIDTFYLTDAKGRKIGATQLQAVRDEMERTLEIV